MDKEGFKLAYLKCGTIKAACREYRIYYMRYEQLINSDRQFYNDIMEIRELIKKRSEARRLLNRKIRKPAKKFDEERFLEALEDTGHVDAACRVVGIWTQKYYEHKKQNKAFAEKADEIINELRLDRHHAKRINTTIIKEGWTPPNQGLIEYERWR